MFDVRLIGDREAIDEVSKPVKIDVVDANFVASPFRGQKPHIGITAVAIDILRDGAPVGIAYLETRIEGRTDLLSDDATDIARAGHRFERPHIDVFAWKDATIDGHGHVDGRRSRQSILLLLDHLR